MRERNIFSNELINVMKDAKEIAEDYEISEVTPLILFKAILDLETNPIYDYLMNSTSCDNDDFEMVFDGTLDYYSLGTIANVKQNENEKEVKPEQEENKVEEEKREKSCFFIISNTNEKIYHTEKVAIIITRATQISKERKSEIVQLEYMINAIAENIPKDILKFLRNLEVNVKNFKKTFSYQKTTEAKNILPEDLQSFIKVLNGQYKKNTHCSIMGRDKECESVWRTLQKRTKRNVILIGEPGVGKSSIAKKITHDIVNEKCPDCFKDFIVISVNVNATISGTMYRGQAEERFKKLIDFLEETDNVILFIDEIHTILGAGACIEGEMDLANALKPILAEDKVRVIGATTSEEYEKYFSKDGALKRRFRPIEIREPKTEKVYPMLKNSIAELSKYHSMKISKAIVEYIILISSCFNYETSNPDRTIDLVDLSMVMAKSDGKQVVDKKSVLKNFDINFKKFEKMDYKVKKSTAYHEAGHYLVWRFSGRLQNLDGIAISIMPASDYLGVTIFNKLDDEVTVSRDMEYFIDSIAMDLAGRVAEKMYTNTISSGASSDLEKATRYAYSIVTRYGMMEEFGKNRVYFDSENYTMCNEKAVDNINAEVDKVIDKAYERAEQILSENEVYLRRLVNQLIKKGILSKKELERIFERNTNVHN